MNSEILEVSFDEEEAAPAGDPAGGPDLEEARAGDPAPAESSAPAPFTWTRTEAEAYLEEARADLQAAEADVSFLEAGGDLRAPAEARKVAALRADVATAEARLAAQPAEDVLEVILEEEEEAPAPVNPAALVDLEAFFGAPVIYSYTRRQAVADGMQFRAPAALAAEAGITWPVYITSAVYEEAIRIPEGVEAQDETGRLWDVLWLAALTARTGGGAGPVAFVVNVRQDNEGPARPCQYYLQAGAVDIDDPAPCLTIMTSADL